MHYKLFPRFGFWLCAAALFLGLSLPATAADGDDEHGELFDTVVVPEGLTKEDVRDVIVKAFVTRGWTVKERSDTRVVGYLKHRANEATATFMFGPEEIQMYCEGWALNRDGSRRKPEQPRGWLNFLKKDLNKQLNARALGV